MEKFNPKLYNTDKPIISWVPWLKKWVCRMYHKRYDRIITGHGAKVETAFKAYKRRLRWEIQGRPGATRFPRESSVRRTNSTDTSSSDYVIATKTPFGTRLVKRI